MGEKQQFLFLGIVLLLLMSGTANSSRHHHRHNKKKKPNAGGIQQSYMNWVKKMSSRRNHTATSSSFSQMSLQNHPCKLIKVNRDPKLGDFTTLNKAIDSIPLFNPCRAVISVAPGIYREKIEIPATMAYVTIQGSGANKTIVRWDDTADKLGPNGQPLGTYGSATFAVNAPYFIAKDITFKNKAPPPPAGAIGKQAVALRISADMAAFLNCKFIGAQDTLYDHKGRHYFNNCHIQGSVDFIFGDGLSLYDGCRLHAKTNTYGALTAQKRESMLEETGFSFVNCQVTGSGALYLGRAWGSFSRVVFAYTYMQKIITPRGWYDWGDKQRQMTVFYGQFKCSGPGADYGGRVSWARELTEEEAQPFISLSFIDGHDWLIDIED